MKYLNNHISFRFPRDKASLCNHPRLCAGYTHGTGKTGKTGKMAKRIPCQGKHREFGNFVKTQGILSKHRENTGNFVSSSCALIAIVAAKKTFFFFFFQKLDRSAKSVLCM